MKLIYKFINASNNYIDKFFHTFDFKLFILNILFIEKIDYL